MIPFFLFQIDVMAPTREAAASMWSDLLLDPAVISVFWLIATIVAVFIALQIIRTLFVRRGRFRTAFDMQVLLVRVPKELKKEDANTEKSNQQVQEAIGMMETVYAALGSLKPQGGLGAWLLGRADAVSFEIVACQDKISFFVSVPTGYRSFIEEQIHAQYSNAQIEEVPDYNIFHPTGVILGSYLTFRREHYFPIKTYKKQESDSITSLTNALSKIEVGDGAAIQYIMRPTHGSWRKAGMHIAREMHQGKKMSEARGGFWYGLWRVFEHSSRQADERKPENSYKLSPLEEEMIKGLEEKSSKAGLEVNIRLMVSSQSPEKAQRYLNDLLGAYGIFNIYEYGNSFSKNMPRFQSSIVRHFIYRHFDDRYRVLLNAEEAATIYHFPSAMIQTPKIDWLLSRRSVPPTNLPTEGILLGISDYRGRRYEVRMRQEDRRRHMYAIGKSGTGKSAFLASLIRQDILAGRGLCVIDPHGDLADTALTYVPKERAEDVIFFDPADYERPMGINMLEYDRANPQLRTFVINEMLKIFDRLYDLKSTGGPMFEVYMRNAILLLMDHPESGMTLMDIPRVLADEEYRTFKLSKCTSQEVKDFWQKEALKAGGESSLANMVPYITSKLASFIYNDYMRVIVGQQVSSFNVREAMDQGKIIIMKLSKGKIGDINANLLGMILVGKILNAALARADMDEKDRKDFYLYIDEFQNVLTDSIASILSEARKYGLDLIIAHQYISQLTMGANKDTTIRDAVFGNVGTMLAYRVGADDAEFLVKEFSPGFSEYDLMNAEALTLNTKLLIDNTISRPFNMKMQFAPRPGAEEKERAELIRNLSRLKYGRKREIVEAEMKDRKSAIMEDDITDDLSRVRFVLGLSFFFPHVMIRGVYGLF